MTRIKTDKADSFFIAEYRRTFLMESFINQKQLTISKNKKIINLRTNEKIEREFRILELIRKIEKSIKELEKEIKELSNKLLRPFDENFCT